MLNQMVTEKARQVMVNQNEVLKQEEGGYQEKTDQEKTNRCLLKVLSFYFIGLINEKSKIHEINSC